MLAWEKWRPASMRLVPGALLGVVAGTVTALVLDMNVARVEVPDSILAAITPPTAFASWLTPEIIAAAIAVAFRSEEHTSELQSLMRISYAVFCLKNKTLSDTPT